MERTRSVESDRTESNPTTYVNSDDVISLSLGFLMCDGKGRKDFLEIGQKRANLHEQTQEPIAECP